MGNLWVWLLAAVLPLAKKVLLGLGIGWVSYELVTAAVQAAINAVVSQWNTLDATVGNFMTMFGFTQTIGIVLGAISARMAIQFMKRLGRVTA